MPDLRPRWYGCWWMLALALPALGQQHPVTPPDAGASAEPTSAALPGMPRVLTLEQAQAYATAHQPTLLAARARLEAAIATTGVPRALWYPRLGVTAQELIGTANNTTGSYVSVGTLDLPRIGGTPAETTGTWDPHGSSLAAVGVRQELFDFGRIAALSALTDAEAATEKERSNLTTLAVRFQVEQSYFAVLAAKAVLRASEAAYTRALAHRDFAQVGVTQGMRSPIELTRAAADLARADVQRTRARGGVIEAQAVFAATVGVDDARLDAAEAPSTAVEAAPPMDQILRHLAATDPNVRAAQARLAEQQATTRIYSTALLPELFLSGTLSGRAGGAPIASGAVPSGNGYLPNVPNWDAAIVLVWPVLDFGVFAQRSASESQERARQAEIVEAGQQSTTAIQQAYAALEVALAALPGLEEALQAALANSAQADARFREGLGTSVELADAESLRTDAEIQLAVGRFDAARARAQLGRVIAEGL
ncbi:MAG TPA: TolC family protein [Myxococcaceae bacterium]|nr:TolC family protein [Myxococcaceae bacterium]